MAHSCPDCDEVCYCGGDIDDCEFDLPPVGGCSHICQDEAEAWREEEEREEEQYFERLRQEDPPA